MAHRISLVLSSVLFASLSACSHKPPPKPVAAARPAAPAPKAAPRAATANVDVGTPSKLKQTGAILFDFDSSQVREDARPTLQELAQAAKATNGAIHIEGHTDERGTTEYNLALGDRRARAAQEYLQRLGVPAAKISVATFGSERPRASGHDEAAWQQNRRGELVVR